jgi:xylan 1,4-beta-xylosidase
VTFDARDGHEAAGLHLFHDPLMNLWLAVSAIDGVPHIVVGKHTLGVRQDLWSVASPYPAGPAYLRVVVSDPETATFFYGGDGKSWRQIGESIYIGASGHHVREGKRGDPDLGWVGRYKEAGLTPEQVNGLPEHQRQAQRGGNVWTAATFGVFAVQDGASASKPADFEYLRVKTMGSDPVSRVPDPEPDR